MIGVNVKAQYETMLSVPYLTHLDYARQVRELTEFVDYVVLNLSEELGTSGMLQYYKRGTNAMNKLLEGTHKARVNELGKVAACQHESYL